MKYPQPASSEEREDPAFYMKGAEKAFIEFTNQLFNKNAKGFISESENGKIFSFETYLRETGRPEDEIVGYCKHAKAGNLLEKAASKARSFKIVFEKGFLKGLLVLIAIGFAVSLIVYLVVAALLLVFSVSLWNVKSFFAFTSIGTVLVVVRMFLKPAKKGKNGTSDKQAAPLYVIKYFDNDELTFTKAKSRLFVEGQAGGN
jgi:hypothetical protein